MVIHQWIIFPTIFRPRPSYPNINNLGKVEHVRRPNSCFTMRSNTYSKVIQPHSNLTTRINQIKSCFYSGLLQPTRGQGPSLLFVNTLAGYNWLARLPLYVSHNGNVAHTHTHIEFAFHISVNVVTFGSWFSKAATYKYVHSWPGPKSGWQTGHSIIPHLSTTPVSCPTIQFPMSLVC